jgi:hypothetical protein
VGPRNAAGGIGRTEPASTVRNNLCTAPNLNSIRRNQGTGLPDSKVGPFTQAMYDEAKQKGWMVISMRDDWKDVFPPTTVGGTTR